MALLTTLQSRKFVKAGDIAAKYEISIRTVYRDIKALNEIGVPVYFEPSKGYGILPGFFLPPVSFTSEEANALVLMVSLSEKFADKTLRKNADKALEKIKSVLRSKERERADFLHSQIRIYKPPTEVEVNDNLTTIQTAILNREILKIEYKNNFNEVSEREIEPIGLTFYSNQWHLIAWCWKREAYRDFKVLQIRQLENKKKSFEKHEHLSIDQYIGLLN